MPTSLSLRLEALYSQWHHPRFLGTDPLILVRDALPSDREVTAFLISCLALGRASLIVAAGRDLLGRLGTPLAPRLAEAPVGAWLPKLAGFGYRFFPAVRVAALLDSVGALLRQYGSLQAAWASTGSTGWSALDAFSALVRAPGGDVGVLVPVPDSKGAAKRLNLFLRWMVRRDELDLGLWTTPSPAELFMPVDTHVLQWARAEGLTSRTAADQRASWEITAALRQVRPDDPLRYDFAITRAGMAAKNTLKVTGLPDAWLL